MMIPQLLTPELSKPAAARSRRCAPSRMLCWAGVLGSVLACKGTIDNNEQASGLRPASAANGSNMASPGSNAGAGMSPVTAGAGEAGGDNVRGLDGEASATRPRGSTGRARDRERDDDDAGVDEEDTDAGVIDVDAGNVDGGVIDADAGSSADAGAASP